MMSKEEELKKSGIEPAKPPKEENPKKKDK